MSLIYITAMTDDETSDRTIVYIVNICVILVKYMFQR